MIFLPATCFHLPARWAVRDASAASYFLMGTARDSKSLSLVDRPMALPLTNTKLPFLPLTLSTWRTPFLSMEASRRPSRYFPRPRGQRRRAALVTEEYSFTRPLILVKEESTLMFFPLKTEGMELAPAPTPSAFLIFTAESAATWVRRSPMEERFLPLPLDVLEQLARGNIGVGLEGQVVVGELLVVALDGLEELVGGFLNLDRDLHKESSLGLGETRAGTVGNSLGLGLTLLDELGDLGVHLGVEGLVLSTGQGTVLLAVGRVGTSTGGLDSSLGLLAV